MYYSVIWTQSFFLKKDSNRQLVFLIVDCGKKFVRMYGKVSSECNVIQSGLALLDSSWVVSAVLVA